MFTHPYRYRTMHMVLIGLGIIPFVIWGFASRSIWPEVSAATYLVTAVLFLTLVIGFPGPGCRWYWKVVSIMAILHLAVLSILVLAALAMVRSEIKPPTTMLFGLVVVLIMAVEARVALRLIQRFLQKN